jgi:hypothetical protein
MRSFALALCCVATFSWAQAPSDPPTTVAPAEPPKATAPAEPPKAAAASDETAPSYDPPPLCASSAGLHGGPAAFGYVEGDFASGRRACPRSEVGLGVRGLVIIDTPNFYGNVGGQGLLFGSWAFRRQTEVFATLEAVTFGFTQNATLTKLDATLGHFTAGITQVVYERSTLAGSVTGRVLLPSSFEIPGMRLMGAEVGHAVSFRPRRWIEVHGSVNLDLTFGIGPGRSDPRVGGFGVVGAMWQPIDWFGLVVDVSGRVARVSYLAPMVALRFKIGSLGIELGASLPVVGNDRHDVVGGLRVSWKF